MDCQLIEKYIIEFFDGEIKRENEQMLFSHLSQCDSCRNKFKEYNLIENLVNQLTEEFPDSLDNRIINRFYLLEEKNKNESRMIKFYRYAVVGLSIILIGFLLFFFNSIQNFEQKLNLSYKEIIMHSEEIKNQQEQIEILMNSLNPIEVINRESKSIIITN